jgi:hypothetical protein
MFRFMYGLESENSALSSHIGYHYDVYRLGRYYEVDGLQKLAFRKLSKCTKEHWDLNAFVKMLETELSRYDGDSVDSSFESFLTRMCHKNISELCKDAKFKEIVAKGGKLAVLLTQGFGAWLEKYRCPQCKKGWTSDITILPDPSYCPNCGHYRRNWDNFVE